MLKFLTGFVVSSLIILGTYFGYNLYSNHLHNNTENIQETSTPINNESYQNEQTSTQQEKYQTSTRKPNLHDTNKAMTLMSQNRDNLSPELQKEYDSVIETAKTNVENNVANNEDQQIIKTYNNINK